MNPWLAGALIVVAVVLAGWVVRQVNRHLDRVAARQRIETAAYFRVQLAELARLDVEYEPIRGRL